MEEFVDVIKNVMIETGINLIIFFGLSSWLGKLWAKRILNKESSEYKEKIEYLIKDLERENYICKVRFNEEISIYRDLCQSVEEMVRVNDCLFPIIDNIPVDKNELYELQKRRFSQAAKFYDKSHKKLVGKGPFIPKNIYDSFLELHQSCRAQIICYAKIYLRNEKNDLSGLLEKCYERTNKIDDLFKNVMDELRNYLYRSESANP